METYKQLKYTLGDTLIEHCKQKKDRNTHLQAAERLLTEGADVNFGGSRPMHFAVKNYNFELISLLVSFGALDSELSRKYLASLCEKGKFSADKEEAFFDLIDLAIKKTGFSMTYLAAYINMTLLQGRIDKLSKMAEKYAVRMTEAIACTKQMVIFELIQLDKHESLKLINSYLNWEAEAIDTAITQGNAKVTEYILEKNKGVAPSKDSIAKAAKQGHANVLDVLDFYGIGLSDSMYTLAACKNLPQSAAALKFLLEKGTADEDIYKIAKMLNNPYLNEFLRKL